VLRVWEQNGEEVAGTKRLAEKRLQEPVSISISPKNTRATSWFDHATSPGCDKSRLVGFLGHAKPWVHGDPCFEFFYISDVPFDIHFADLRQGDFRHVHTEAGAEVRCKVVLFALQR
jgi:hypothetical protein